MVKINNDIKDYYIEKRRNISIENRDRKYIINDPFYMEWLIRYLESSNNSFSDFDIGFDEFDNQNIARLHILYSIIKEYIYKNYLVEYMDRDTFYFKYNDNYLKINREFVNKTYKYSISKSREKAYYLNFNDIIEDKKSDIKDTNDKIVKGLIGKIEELYQNGLSIDFIREILDKILFEVKTNNNDYVYTKKR